MSDLLPWSDWVARMQNLTLIRGAGRVKRIKGLMIEAIGPEVALGQVCMIQGRNSSPLLAEVVGFCDENVELMPYGSMAGVSPGARVVSLGRGLMAKAGDGVLGRVMDPLGNPLDGKGPIEVTELRDIDCDPPNRSPVPGLIRSCPWGFGRLMA